MNINDDSNEGKIQSIVRNFFEKISLDDKLKDLFNNFDHDRIEHHPKTFYSHSFGEEKYSRDDIANAHKDIKIDDEHFESMVDHFVQSLHSEEFNEQEKLQAKSQLMSYKNEVLGK